MGSVWATDREGGKGCRRLRGVSSARERVEKGQAMEERVLAGKRKEESGNGAAAASW